MSRLWSPFVQNLVPYTPGEQPKHRSFVKLNTNENPYGPSPKVIAAIAGTNDDSLRLYPDPTAGDLRQAIAATHGLSMAQVFAGNGSDEVLAHAFNAFFRDKGPVLFADVTYSFYPTYCNLYGLEYRTLPLDAEFRLDPAAYEGPCGGIVIANPNAPTGRAPGLAAIRDVLDRNPDVVVIVDEAYVDFGGDSAAPLIAEYDNLLVVQTFSKSRSLAGLRVGFALGHPDLIEGLMRVKDSFNSYPLGRPALAGALAAWQDRAHFDETRAKVMASRAHVTEGLSAQGFTVLPSQANFVFARHPDVAGADLMAGLRERGILVRHFGAERIRDWLRISIGTEADCAALLAATADLVAH